MILKTYFYTWKDEDKYEAARRWNHLGKVVYVVLYLIFNIAFWAVAIQEYVRPAEEYINKKPEYLDIYIDPKLADKYKFDKF